MTTIPAKTIYLSNKDLLKEIHHSKMTYCWVEKPEYYYYDLIIGDLTKFHNRKNIQFPKGAITTARENRVNRIAAQALEKAELAWKEKGQKGPKPKLDQFLTDPKKVPLEELVIRVPSFEHIPEEPGRKNKPKITFLTDRGNWDLKKRAENLDMFIQGQFYKTKLYDTSPFGRNPF